jgi:hypothetical protein
MLMLQNELGESEIEILFVQGVADRNIERYLTDNRFPFVGFGSNAEALDDNLRNLIGGFENGVVQSRGKFLLLTNSFLIYPRGFMVKLLAELLHSSQSGSSFSSLSPRLISLAFFPKFLVARLARDVSSNILTNFLAKCSLSRDALFPFLISRQELLKLPDFLISESADSSFASPNAHLKNGFPFFISKESVVFHYTSVFNKLRHLLQLDRHVSGVSWDDNLFSMKSDSVMDVNSISSENSRLHITRSVRHAKSNQKMLLLMDDLYQVKNIKLNRLEMISACVTSNPDVVRFLSLEKNLHTYFLSKADTNSSVNFIKLLNEIITNELKEIYSPKDVPTIKSRILKIFPRFLVNIIKSTRSLFRPL